MLLGVGGVPHLATRQFKDGHKVCIDCERCFSTIIVLVEFDLHLFEAWHRMHMEHRHKVVSSTMLLV